jgi:NADPH2:quinone reductase
LTEPYRHVVPGRIRSTLADVWGIQIDRQGGPDELIWRELPEPEPGSGEVVVELATAGLNYIDVYHRSGLYPVVLPYVPGLEGAGTVVAVGDGVAWPAVGDRVGWANTAGSYAELVVIPADKCVSVPDAVPLELAAALLLQGMTAHFLTHDTFPLGEAHRCLIHAGAGGVGLLLVQIAKLLGAEVFTTVGSPDKAELATAAGADHVILYREVDFAEKIVELAGPRPLDVVYDGVGRDTFSRGLQLLRLRGTMVSFGNASGAVEPISPLELSANGSLYLTRPTLFHHTVTQAETQRRADDLFAWVEAGRLDVRIGDKYDLQDAADAHRALEGRQTTGKVLLIP